MARDGLLSKIGLALGCLVAVVLILVVALGYINRSREETLSGSTEVEQRRDPGWEIRYTATAALARRGSDLVKDRLDVLAEMLDEEKQQQNFRANLKKGREVPNEAEVVQALTRNLQAVAELHRRNPRVDLAPLVPAIDKLTQHSNITLRTEALRTKNVLENQ
jgi:hypothetical protein